jgi:hypothetical protein
MIPKPGGIWPEDQPNVERALDQLCMWENMRQWGRVGLYEMALGCVQPPHGEPDLEYTWKDTYALALFFAEYAACSDVWQRPPMLSYLIMALLRQQERAMDDSVAPNDTIFAFCISKCQSYDTPIPQNADDARIIVSDLLQFNENFLRKLGLPTTMPSSLESFVEFLEAPDCYPLTSGEMEAWDRLMKRERVASRLADDIVRARCIRDGLVPNLDEVPN